jgi:hypothetical protein
VLQTLPVPLGPLSPPVQIEDLNVFESRAAVPLVYDQRYSPAGGAGAVKAQSISAGEEESKGREEEEVALTDASGSSGVGKDAPPSTSSNVVLPAPAPAADLNGSLGDDTAALELANILLEDCEGVDKGSDTTPLPSPPATDGVSEGSATDIAITALSSPSSLPPPVFEPSKGENHTSSPGKRNHS